MVEALEQNISAAAAGSIEDEDLLIDTVVAASTVGPAKVQVPPTALAVNNALDDSYEETAMNPNGFFNLDDEHSASVKVAVRVRPLVGRELRDTNRRSCIESQPELNKLTIGSSSFSYDRVFDTESYQEDIYEVCSKNLILGCFAGYNATILAYGQTGSGKTHTMGTGSTVGLPIEQIGIVPRVFDFLFQEIENRRKQSDFSEFNVKVQFLELYGDDIRDLLDTITVDKITGNSTKVLKISEAKNGSISVTGLKAELVTCKAECISLLNKGIAQRMTAQTQMNEASSRSHAVFTVTIEQKIVKVTQPADSEPQPADAEPITSEENISAKFHFVDLAGSERIKKTGATGKTLQEGIQINQGLSALGNVIAALTDGKTNSAGKAFIPYRNSKLTRILQDSLGGNSRTTMIACVSPAESNYEETLSTIKYASRARNIKNKPVVNRDANSMLIEALRNQITSLQTEIGEYQTLLKGNNIAIPDEMKEVIEAKAQETSSNRRSSVMSTQGIGGLLGKGPSQGGAQANLSTGELRDLKLKLARSEKENKELREQISEIKKTGVSKASENDEVQNERDQLIMKNEALNELLSKNNISMPSSVSQQAHTTGGKRTQTVIDEYKAKTLKAQEESKAKTAEILQKSKKITELQSALKRDEALLKSKISEAEKYKKIVSSQKPQERLIVQPVAMPGVKNTRGQPRAGEQQVPDAEEIKNQFMDKLTSQLENYFAADATEGEGAKTQAEEDSLLEKINTGDDSTDPTTQIEEGGQAMAEQAHAEASRATSLEEKEKLLSAVKQNVDQIKSDLGELLKNTWAQRIQEIQTQMGKMEQDKRKTISAAGENSAQTKAIEKEYKQKMEVLQNQLNDQQRQKKKKEDNIQKTMMQQESRLKAMEIQLGQMKKQKDEAVNSQKYGEERFTKFKSNVNKDLITYKKTVKDKDQAVYKLKTDLKKTDILVSQKIMELKSLQKKAREDGEKRRKEEESERESKGIDIDSIKDWIHQSTDQLLKQQELNEYLKKQQDQREDIEDDMLKEGDRLTDLIVQKERLEFEMEANGNAPENGGEMDEERQLEIEAELEDVCLESDSITATLDVLEEHLDHVETKISQITSEIKAFDLDSVQAPRFKGLNNVDNARATLKTFFMVLLDLNVYKKDLENKLIEQDETVLELSSKVTILQETSSLSSVQQQAAFRKQQAMRQLVGQLGEGTEFMDNRASADMHLSTTEQTQLTKMSLSKIVTNLRNKLKDEEKRNQSVSNKLDQIIKEKEQIKQKYQQLQKEIKTKGGSVARDVTGGSFASNAYEPPSRSISSSGTGASKSLSAVKSRINTGRSASGGSGQQAEPFIGHMSRSAATKRNVDERPKKMSFKQRRDQVKQESAGKSDLSATQENVDSLSRRPGVVKSKIPISNLKDARNKAKMGGNESQNQALSQNIDDLENEVKTNVQSVGSTISSKKRQYMLASQQPVKPKAEPDDQYLTAPSQPETVMEEPDLEGSDQDEELMIEESDDVLADNLSKAEARLQQLEADEEIKVEAAGDSLLGLDSEQQHRFGNMSLLGDSILQHETPDDYNWEFEGVADLVLSVADQKIVDVDSVDERCFILFSDLKLTEINLQTKAVVQEINVASLDGATEYLAEPTDQKALAFAMFKELNMIAVSTADGLHMFDYEAELQHVKTLQLRNVRQICFVEMYIVLVVEDADDSGSDGEALLLCYMIDSDEPEGQIKIKEFLGHQVKVQPSEQSVCFVTGSQIGRIQVPEMELMFQEDAGHKIIDFSTNDTCIFTTGEDSSLRLFDSDQGMMLIEPMADMEVDRLAVQGRHLVARCGGGQAMMVFKYTDGDEELAEEDFIECEDLFGDGDDSNNDSKFLMKGGLKVALSGTEYNMILTCYQDAEGNLSVKMLKNKSYGGV